MKRLLALLCVLVMLVSLAACAKKDETPEEPANPIEDMSLADIMDAILDGVQDLPAYEPMELTEENFEFFTFLPYSEGYEGLAADALIGSIAHSVVLVRVGADADAGQAAADMEDNADPRKWICVEAEKTVVRQHGNTILLVMSSGETANAILTNFDALNGMETPASDLELPEGNPDVDVVGPVDDEMLDQPASPDGPEDNMPTLEPGEGSDDNMPALDPGDGAVEMPNANPKPETPAVTPVPPAEKPLEPEKPAEPAKPVEPETPVEPEAPDESGTELSAAMASILENVEELPGVWDIELTSENFEFYAFIPYAEGYRGLASDAMIGSIAHSAVLVEVPAGVDASKVAEDMAAGANPRKWICVEAESVQTAVKGQLVLLVMSSQSVADAIVGNFNAL